MLYEVITRFPVGTTMLTSAGALPLPQQRPQLFRQGALFGGEHRVDPVLHPGPGNNQVGPVFRLAGGQGAHGGFVSYNFV